MTRPHESVSKEEAKAALIAHAFTVDDPESAENGRTVIHSMMSGLGCDHDLEHALAIVDEATDVFWADTVLGHDLIVVSPGKSTVGYAVRRPDPDHGEGKTDTEEDERFRVKVEEEHRSWHGNSMTGITGKPGTPDFKWDGHTTRPYGATSVQVTFFTQVHPDDADCLTEETARSFVRYVGMIAEQARKGASGG